MATEERIVKMPRTVSAQEKINALEAENKALWTEIAGLKSRIAELEKAKGVKPAETTPVVEPVRFNLQVVDAAEEVEEDDYEGITEEWIDSLCSHSYSEADPIQRKLAEQEQERRGNSLRSSGGGIRAFINRIKGEPFYDD